VEVAKGESAPAATKAKQAANIERPRTNKAGTVDKTGTATRSKAKPDKERAAFLASQRLLLLEERSTYMRSAEALKAQADSLALEHEPGDVQFDEEGGEGGTANVDREIDLHLSAQARATVVEIDRALEKLDDGTYGLCEHCGAAIPEARLEALPYAALCVACKSGGLSSRR
jgi:DnaK suppressor protein